MTNPSDDILNRYRAGTCTPYEKQQVEAWYDSFDHRPTLSEARPETATPAYRAFLFRNIQASISKAGQQVVPFRPTQRVWPYAVAASLTGVLLVAGLWWQRTPSVASEKSTAPITRQPPVSDIRFTNTQSKIVRCELPDGSLVWLNPKARICYPTRFEGPKRSVSFAGEGFFSVQKDARHPFVVRSGRMTTEVLGTSFNVRADPASNHYQVAVVTGKVAVSIQKLTQNTARRVLLKPRQQALVNVVSADIKTYTVPTNAKQALYEPVSITFDWVPLDEVVRRLEAAYDVRIQLAPALRHCRLRADFTNQRLPAILDLLGKSVGVSYAIDGGQITLTGAGCPDESGQ